MNLRMSGLTREELEQQGGYSTKFKPLLTRPHGDVYPIISIDGFEPPEVHIPYKLKELEWELQGKINHIFNDRRDRYKNFVENLLPWLLIAMFVVVFVILLSLEVLHVSAQKIHTTLPSLVAAVAVVTAVLLIAKFKRNGIYLQSSRGDAQARKARSRERFEKLFWAFVCFGSGVV